MEKIPTVKEFMQGKAFSILSIENMIIEFAKLHVEQALKAKIQAMKNYHNDGYSLDEIDAFTRESYPLENIK